jgi:hypothetical protein
MNLFYQGVFVGACCASVFIGLVELAMVWISNRRLNAEWEAKHKREMEELAHKVLTRGGIG